MKAEKPFDKHTVSENCSWSRGRSLTLKEREYVLENKPGSKKKNFLFQTIHFKKQCVNHMENSALIILTAGTLE